MFDGDLDEWVIDRYMDGEEAKKRVLEKRPRAFLKRTTDKYYIYQVRARTGWLGLKTEELGDKHYFKDQAWLSALNNIIKSEI